MTGPPSDHERPRPGGALGSPRPSVACLPDGGRGALPPELDVFVGRAEQVAQGLELLATRRLVTLVGPGGVGKTRLAVRLAHRVADAGTHPDGVVLVGLADVERAGPGEDPARVRARVLARLSVALRVPDNTDDAGVEAALSHRLAGRRVLLVLDNCEHVIGAVRALLPRLLAAGDGVRVLATSTHHLLLSGERPLVVPTLDTDSLDGSGAVPDSVRLLAHLAADHDVDIDPHDDAVRELCRLLDGLPLAIVLAAANLEGQNLDQLVRRLREDPLALRGTEEREDRAHHRSLRAVVDWARELLIPDEVATWATLSQFSGCFSPEEAHDLGCALGVDRDRMTALIGRLLHRSVLVREQRHGQVRLRMLEQVRAYGVALVPEGTPREQIRDAHAAVYLAQAACAANTWYSPREEDVLKTLTANRPNAAAALGRLLASPDTVWDGLRLVVDRARTRAGIWAGRLREDREQIADALAATARHHPGEHRVVEVEAVASGAFLALCQGRCDLGRELLDRAWWLHAVVGGPEPPVLLTAHGVSLWLSPSAVVAGSAPEVLTRAVTAAREQDAPGEEAMAELFLVLVASFGGAASAVESAVVHRRGTEAAGAVWASSWAGIGLAVAEYHQGRLGRAAAALRPALRAQERMGDTWGRTWAVHQSAVLAAAAGAWQEAAELFGAVAVMLRSIGVTVSGLPQWWRVQREATARCVVGLGQSAMEHHTAAGERMGAHEAVASALRLLRTVEADADDADGVDPVERQGKLSAREWQVARLVAQGLKDAEVADVLRLSPRTVESHVRRIRERLGLPNRTALATWLTTQVSHAV
ncbi:Signal transduction response regulator [Actinokineospora spheciospongiae]|uniref:Signal transduction response regulator n=1 Tax=Actinokineospora spheciospongiae TaxID=909613 RepID=W7J2S2_9PSEU|nr:LuxR C-terminal-related transcriptional regulator [Actinokineospora spheciospongiae]EWC63246.1 Signal transduction response regulator [Actinokineospora spheciospongiae]PWW66924.1 non-specific serine/threonine protein kinase [Actinokineospora spheciospongiae]